MQSDNNFKIIIKHILLGFLTLIACIAVGQVAVVIFRTMFMPAFVRYACCGMCLCLIAGFIVLYIREIK